MATNELSIDSGIVVGHDGSALADTAVARAATFAARLGTPLHVVRVWSLTTAPKPSSMTPGYVPPAEDFETAVLEALKEHVDALDLPAGTEVQLHAVRGQSAEKLLEVAQGAELLVVGTRGGGGFRGLLMGSTADQVVRHAKVPVLVVPNAEG